MTMMRTFLPALLAPLSSQAFVQVSMTRHHADAFPPLNVALSRDPREDSNPVSSIGLPEVVVSPTSSKDSTTSVLSEEGSETIGQQAPQRVMSKALPFLECPQALVDCDFAGNVGFDPLGLASSKEQLWIYREAEIKHARLAMLAAAGWPLSELWNRQIAEWFGFPSLLDAFDRVPSPLNEVGLSKVSPTWWGFCFGLTAAIESYGMAISRRGNADYRPGQLGWDPAGFYPTDAAGRRRMALAEIKHGRVAMVAIVCFFLEEFVTHMGVIDEVPFTFSPGATETLEQVVME